MSAHVPDEIKERVREQAGHRCGYCLSRQEYVLGVLEVEHIVPRARGGSDGEENLWLACRLCNHYKAAQTHGHDMLTGATVAIVQPTEATLDASLPLEQ